MKKSLILVFLSLILLSFNSCSDFTYKEYSDIKIYMNKEYFDESQFKRSYVTKAAKHIDEFLIPYEEIDFEYKSIGCYVFDGTQSISKPGVSIAVDFHLGDNYSSVKEKYLNMFEFYEEESYKMNVNGYECLMVKNSKITKYVEFFGLVCFNEQGGIVRQFFYYNIDYDDDNISLTSYFNSCMKKCSNCPW